MRTVTKPAEAWIGVTHSSDMPFIFPTDTSLKHMDEPSRKLSRDMILAWTSFAKRGHPGPMGSVSWLEAFQDKNHPVARHMALDSEHYRMVEGFYKQSCDGFWKAKLFA